MYPLLDFLTGVLFSYFLLGGSGVSVYTVTYPEEVVMCLSHGTYVTIARMNMVNEIYCIYPLTWEEPTN